MNQQTRRQTFFVILDLQGLSSPEPADVFAPGCFKEFWRYSGVSTAVTPKLLENFKSELFPTMKFQTQAALSKAHRRALVHGLCLNPDAISQMLLNFLEICDDSSRNWLQENHMRIREESQLM